MQRRESTKFHSTASLLNGGSRKAYAVEPSATLGSIQNADVAYSRDALQVPKLTGLQLAQLFHRHQPIWSVNVQSSEDRIGTVHRDAQRVFVSTEVPTVYTALSYARFNNEILVQLNYTVWFPSRPKSGPFDILDGHLDGITWRVSLDSNFQVLFADAMHNCGCYYMAFPSLILRHRTRHIAREEPLWTPKFILPDPLSRVVISIASRALVTLADGCTIGRRDASVRPSPDCFCRPKTL